MASTSVRVSARNQIAIPKQVRSQLKIEIGDRFLLDTRDGLMVLLPLYGTFTQALAGLNHTSWEDSQEYFRRERSAWIDSTKS